MFKNKASQDFVSMRNEYFIHNQFIKIKYKIILKQKKGETLYKALI